MSDEFSALVLLADGDAPQRDAALQRFEDRWSADSLVMNSWFTAQASASRDGVPGEVLRLAQHPQFDASNPNKIRALFSAFAVNPRHFHAADGSGYALLADRIIEVDSGNPIFAGRLARSFNAWRRHDPERQGRCETQLRRILEIDGLSRNTFEIISKTLA